MNKDVALGAGRRMPDSGETGWMSKEVQSAELEANREGWDG
jgi:hypothetical protein